MKYHFIINPAAGKGRLADTVVEKIKNSQLAKNLDVDMYFTASGADAADYVRRTATEGEHAFFACGGGVTGSSFGGGTGGAPPPEVPVGRIRSGGPSSGAWDGSVPPSLTRNAIGLGLAGISSITPSGMNITPT